jgi:hypothetical protein
MSGSNGRDHRPGELGADTDAVMLVSHALDMARRRLRYRIAAALIVAAILAAALVLMR